MTILEELKQYAEDCIAGTIISCRKHKWACQRFLNDVDKMERDPDYPYTWDERQAQNIVEWFSLLRHSKGVLAGQPIELTTWQKFRHCQLYGWREKKTGYKRFLKTFTEVARKNSKSLDEAGIALYEISVMATKNHEVYEYYTAGVKRDQSKIVFNEAALMLKGSPLRSKFKVTRDTIEHIRTGSFIKALSAEDGQKGDGTNPAGLILDEYHQHRTTEFYDLGLGSNTKESLLMIITTAGKDLTYPCYVTEYAYCSKVLDPGTDIENDRYLIDICELDPEDYENIENVGNEELWYKANPIRMSYEKGREKIREEYKIAKEIPEHMTAFLTKCMNVWVQAKENGYMDMAKWKACQVDEIPIDTRGMSVYVGFDMSAKTDLTSVAFIIPFESDETDKDGKKVIKYIVYSHSFKEHDWKIETLCFDPANASKLMMDLADEGYDVEEVYQSHKSLNESTQGFREQVYSRNILYTYNPVLNFAMSNAVVRKNNGLIKIDKDATTKRIDPVDAVLCAYKLAMYHTFHASTMEAIDKFLESDW